jgi:hypothetical protein
MRGVIGKVFLGLSAPRMRAVAEWQRDPAPAQKALLDGLVRSAARTRFGAEHHFDSIRSIADYQNSVPLRTYADFKPYWDRVFEGERDVTWPGRPRYFAVTSGTTSISTAATPRSNDSSLRSTSGNKYIPVSDEGIRSQLRVGRDILNFYINHTRDTGLFRGRFMFLGGSTVLKEHPHGILSGDLSGILAIETPLYAGLLRLPTGRTAAIADWEQKLDAVAREAATADVRGIGGTPSWLICVFERVLKLRREAGHPARTLADVWPNLSLLVHGGVNFGPYRAAFEALFGLPAGVGKPVTTLEVYPASEGFIGVEDVPGTQDLLLMMDSGLFYEFIPAEEIGAAKPTRRTVADVETGVNYAIALSTNSGLWSYIVGDTVRFTSLRPHRLRITGRTQQFLSAFGEHLVAEDVELAITAACQATGAQVQDFHVAPIYPVAQASINHQDTKAPRTNGAVSNPSVRSSCLGALVVKDGADDMRPRHQWLVEFLQPPADAEKFGAALDEALRRQNEDYAAHRQGDAGMQPPEIVALPPKTFYRAMKEIGRFGPQNKAPRLRNDREFAEVLLKIANAGP